MDVSFVISEYRCLTEIASCLEALRRQGNALSNEIIVSSNSSYSREEQKRIKHDFPQACWLFNEKNGGFAYAMNRGIEVAAGDVVALLNPDARLLGAIKPALRFLNDHPLAAVLGPKIVNFSGEIQDSVRPFMSPWRSIQRFSRRVLRRQRVLLERGFDYGRSQPVDWVIGAFMMVKRNAIAKTGKLDEGYFMYVEDMDWCKRFRDNGYQVYYFPDLVVEFEGTRRSTDFLTARQMPGRFACAHARSYLRFLLKHTRSFRIRRSDEA